MLVNPKPRTLKDLIPWGEFWDRVQALSVDELNGIAAGLVARQQESYAPLANAARKQLTAAAAEGVLATGLVRVALSLGDLVAYASYPTKAKAFATEPHVWAMLPSDCFDAESSVVEGVFMLNAESPGIYNLERELAGRPLFMEKKTAYRWLRTGPPSVSQQRAIVLDVIAEFERRHPLGRMKKDDFIKAVVSRHPGLSKELAKRLWRDHAPATWRRPGPKTHR
jgi:hypothetical protein